MAGPAICGSLDGAFWLGRLVTGELFRVELKSWENHYAKIEKLPWSGKKVHCAEKRKN